MALDDSLKAMDKARPALQPSLRCSLLLFLAFVCSNVVSLYMGVSWQWSHGYKATSSSRPGLDNREGAGTGIRADSLFSQLSSTEAQLRHTKGELTGARSELKELLSKLRCGNYCLGAGGKDAAAGAGGELGDLEPVLRSLGRAVTASKELREFVSEKQLPLGQSAVLATASMASPVGHTCGRATLADLERYMDYKVGGPCPDDQALAQSLMAQGCEPLPRRRCFAASPAGYAEEPPAHPACLWETPPEASVLWTAYTCKSFECLNRRKGRRTKGRFEDCVDCFDLGEGGRERGRWAGPGGPLDFSVGEVLALKRGSVRIGLDIGGGPGTFAARMREHNVTVVTTTLDLNGPFNSFIAHRGLVPLFLTLAQRLPFLDNTLDLVHSMHVLSNWLPTPTLHFLLFDIDRVLRPGGIFWLDHFFCLQPQLHQTYVPLFESLGYTKLKWGVGPKVDRRHEVQEVYLSAVLEKPMSRRFR